jgi:hypothetical protein
MFSTTLPPLFVVVVADATMATNAPCSSFSEDDAETITRALASIYNGSDARPVRLDEIRWLPWSAQRDLVAILLGTGQADTTDTHIRDAFHAVGGEGAVEWFHRHLDRTAGAEAAEARRRVTARRVRKELTDAAHTYAAARPGRDFLLYGSKNQIEITILQSLRKEETGSHFDPRA